MANLRPGPDEAPSVPPSAMPLAGSRAAEMPLTQPLPPFATMFDRIGGTAVIALGFTIPISVAADNVLLAIIALSFVARGRYRETLGALKANPVFLSALALFGVLAAGTLYGPASTKEAGATLLKYMDLLFIPVIAAFFHDPSVRRRGLYAFATAITVTLVLSAALDTGLIPRSRLFVENLLYPVVFKQSLTHAILMAFGAFVFVQLGAAAQTKLLRHLWYVLAAAAALNIVLLVPGRTGYVVLGALLVYAGYARLRWRGVAVMAAAAAVVFAAAYAGSNTFQHGADRALREYTSWQPDSAAASESSVGLRLEFYRNSLAIVRDHLVAGVGTGGFPAAYAEGLKGSAMAVTRNPHNEYLLIAAQTGIVGLVLLLNLFWQHWRLAPRLAATVDERLARGLLLTIAVGCLFNSLLLDHTEGILYAWFTGLLFAGLQSRENGTPSSPIEQR